MPRPNVSPRRRFQENKELTKLHLDYTDSQHFVIAADAAMLQLVLDEVKDTSDPTTALAYYHRIMGAKQFRNIFAKLAEQEQPLETKKDPTNLDHRA